MYYFKTTVIKTGISKQQDQKERLASFCRKHNMPTTVDGEQDLKDLLHHILVDDDRKLLFCYVPKVVYPGKYEGHNNYEYSQSTILWSIELQYYHSVPSSQCPLLDKRPHTTLQRSVKTSMGTFQGYCIVSDLAAKSITLSRPFGCSLPCDTHWPLWYTLYSCSTLAQAWYSNSDAQCSVGTNGCYF